MVMPRAPASRPKARVTSGPFLPFGELLMSTAIPPPKRLAILGLCCFLVWGHLSDVVTGKEHWPFSNYPMYSGVYRSRTLKTVRLVWITDDARPREIGVGGIYARTKYEGALKRLKTRQDRQRLIAMMRSAVQSERERRKEYGIQPQVRGLRVYQLTYHMTPRLEGRAVPDETVLVAQVGVQTGDYVRQPATRPTTARGAAPATTRPSAPPAPHQVSPPAEAPASPSPDPD
jgi:hypothetical protein